jgi:hypothetical protein
MVESSKSRRAGTTVLDAAFDRDFNETAGRETLEIIHKAGHGPTVLYAAATGDIDLDIALNSQSRHLGRYLELLAAFGKLK